MAANEPRQPSAPSGQAGMHVGQTRTDMAGAGGLVQARNGIPWLEPLDAYRRLRASGEQVLLLASAGPHPESRWSFLALDPVVEVRLQGDSFEERWSDGSIVAGKEAPLDYLRQLTDRSRFPSQVDAEVPFTGGWAGFFGFGFAHAIEPTLPRSPLPTEGEAPDAILRLCRSVIAFDHLRRSVTAYAADLEGDLVAAEERLARWVAALRGNRELVAGPPPEVHAWTSSLGESEYEAAVRKLKAQVHAGDHFQANLATRFSAPLGADPADLFERLLASNPSPFMALMEFDGLAIASGSPESLFDVQDGLLRSRPIAGTRKRGADAASDARMAEELGSDPKEQAEHTMLVDLVRNDVAKVCMPGTVRVTERGSIERYRHVMHLVSSVEGKVRPGTGFVDWLAALFPGGTVTGAPKVRATQRILETEPVPRGPYTGSAGYLDWSHGTAWNILIRTLVLQRNPGNAAKWTAHVHAGSGIVADSDPQREWQEANRKARSLLEASTGGPVAPVPDIGTVQQGRSWSPPRAGRGAPARVLVIDNYDSFVHNLADYLAGLGAEVLVVRNDSDWRTAMARLRPTHAVLSPGPGWPDEAGCTLDVVRELHGRIPMLGVCLGHQAIGQAHGAQVRVHPSGPVHGKPAWVHHAGGGLFAGLPSPLEAARYHSLVVADVGEDWHVDAWLHDGTVMAIRHRAAPVFGLQFHPESLCTPLGLELIDRFLAVRAAGSPIEAVASQPLPS